MAATQTLPTRVELEDARVLLVDDEENVLSGLRRQLRGHVEVETATDPQVALRLIETQPAFAVVISDMRMPDMNGAAFLQRFKERSPDTVRMLLTGYADVEAAVAAVNDGQIFRFLWKPCPPDQLLGAIRDAVGQYRLITAEKELLEETLRGSVQALVETLALANPIAFTRAERIKRQVVQLAQMLDVSEPWEVEIAAMLSQIGTVSLPPHITERLHRGDVLTPAQQEHVDRLPEESLAVLSAIPRIGSVREAIRMQRQRFDGRGPVEAGRAGEDIPLNARMLRIAVDVDTLDARGTAPQKIIRELRSDRGAYDPDIVAVLEQLLLSEAPLAGVREIELAEVGVGMVFADDVTTHDGVLVCGQGQEVTARILDRLRAWDERTGLRQPLRVK